MLACGKEPLVLLSLIFALCPCFPRLMLLRSNCGRSLETKVVRGFFWVEYLPTHIIWSWFSAHYVFLGKNYGQTFFWSLRPVTVIHLIPWQYIFEKKIKQERERTYLMLFFERYFGVGQLKSLHILTYGKDQEEPKRSALQVRQHL